MEENETTQPAVAEQPEAAPRRRGRTDFGSLIGKIQATIADIEKDLVAFEEDRRKIAARLAEAAKFEESNAALKGISRFLRRQKEERRNEDLARQCADQPAGVPTFLSNPDLRICFAPSYLGDKPRKRISRRERRENDRRSQAKFEEWLARHEADPKATPKTETEALWSSLCEWGSRKPKRVLRNQWYSTRLRTFVAIVEDTATGICSKIVHPAPDNSSFKLDLYTNTYEAAQVYTLEAEAKAMECLQKKVTKEQYLKYVTTGTIIEQSKRSRLWYIFRRCRPTLVYRETPDPDNDRPTRTFVSALCVHPQGYYGCSWAGTLVPTDDIIAHLLLMRADEGMYWRKSTQHSRFSPQADI